MGEVVIRAVQLSKLYRIVADLPYRNLRDEIARGLRRWRHRPAAAAADPGGEFWALRDVSLEVRRGEVLGIVGANGAGKSTLLKILARITLPTRGWAEVTGRVGSLLEIGAGFNSELSGRENIYVSGALLGMKRDEIARRFDEIVDFAEVGPFLGTPVKHYSNGMYVRLAFSVAAHLRADVLLIDEALAVGDAVFQARSLEKIRDLARRGRTALVVSHNMGVIRNLCATAALFEHGRITRIGPSAEVIEAHIGAQSR